jgi:EamA-like transporter family
MITPVALARRCTRAGSAEGRGGRRARLNYQIISSEGATIASTVTDLMPIIATILGVIVLNESITVLIVAGIVLILSVRRSPGHASRRVPPTAPG